MTDKVKSKVINHPMNQEQNNQQISMQEVWQLLGQKDLTFYQLEKRYVAEITALRDEVTRLQGELVKNTSK